jgi:ferredoxin
MAMKIVEECISCGACEPECPNQAISSDAAAVFTIDAVRCTECVGAHDAPRCVEVCPVDGCIVIDPACMETREELQEKYGRLHA